MFNNIAPVLSQNRSGIIELKTLRTHIDFTLPNIKEQLDTHYAALTPAGPQQVKILEEIKSEIINHIITEIGHTHYSSCADLVNEAVVHPLFDYSYSRQLADLINDYGPFSLGLSNAAKTALVEKKTSHNGNVPIQEKLRGFIIYIDDYISELKQELSTFTFFENRKIAKLNGAILLKETVQSLMNLDNTYAQKLNALQTHLNTNKRCFEGGEHARFKSLIEEFQELIKNARQEYPATFFGTDLNLEDALSPHK